MRQTMLSLWNDDCGYVYKLEVIFVATILVLGCITSLVALRTAVIVEAVETAQAIMALNQSYSFSGQSNCQSSTAGSSASDTTNTIVETSTAASTSTVNDNPCD